MARLNHTSRNDVTGIYTKFDFVQFKSLAKVTLLRIFLRDKLNILSQYQEHCSISFFLKLYLVLILIK